MNPKAILNQRRVALKHLKRQAVLAAQPKAEYRAIAALIPHAVICRVRTHLPGAHHQFIPDTLEFRRADRSGIDICAYDASTNKLPARRKHVAERCGIVARPIGVEPRAGQCDKACLSLACDCVAVADCTFDAAGLGQAHGARLPVGIELTNALDRVLRALVCFVAARFQRRKRPAGAPGSADISDG